MYIYTNSHQLETFLSLVERDFFPETSKKNIKKNLSKNERGDGETTIYSVKIAIWSCDYRIKATDLL